MRTAKLRAGVRASGSRRGRYVESHAVGKVENLRPELDSLTLGYLKVPDDGLIPFPESRTPHGSHCHIPVGTRGRGLKGVRIEPGNAGRGRTGTLRGRSIRHYLIRPLLDLIPAPGSV